MKRLIEVLASRLERARALGVPPKPQDHRAFETEMKRLQEVYATDRFMYRVANGLPNSIIGKSSTVVQKPNVFDEDEG